MTPMTLALQIVLPLVLLAWLWGAPAASWAGLALQTAGTGLILLAMARALLWGVPPRWVAWAALALWALGAGRAAWGLAAGAPAWPAGTGAWAAAGLGGLLAALGGVALFAALSAARPPDGAPVELASPFGSGRALVAHGGRGAMMNVHTRVLAPEPRYDPWRGQAYAADFLGLGPLGLSGPLRVDPDPAAYAIFGAPLVAPCAGRVVAAEGGLPDMAVPRMDGDRKLGNHVILDCGGVHVVLAHLRRGSVRVAPGEAVPAGAALGEVGNSGNSSQPHLHLHAQTPGTADAPISGRPLPMRIAGRALTRNDVLAAPGRAGGRGAF